MKEQYIKRSESNPGAILSTDISGLEQYKKAKQRYADMQSTINTLKEEIKLIKELLLK
jgi:chromosome segregation ATPase